MCHPCADIGGADFLGHQRRSFGSSKNSKKQGLIKIRRLEVAGCMPVRDSWFVPAKSGLPDLQRHVAGQVGAAVE